MKNEKKEQRIAQNGVNVLRLTETAIMIAVATVLSLLKFADLPFGGTVTVMSQLPLIILAYRYGTSWGIFSGMVFGLLQMMMGLNNFSYVTGITAYLILIFSDYLLAFASLGFGGVFRKTIGNQPLSLACGAILGSILRYLCHFISGVTIWSGYAPSQAISAVVKYSLLYNASYMVPELIITVIGALAIGGILDFRTQNIRPMRKKSN